MTTDTKAIRSQMEALAGHTMGPWRLCAHLANDDENGCSCGYRGVIYGPQREGYAVCQPGHEPAPEGQEGTEPPRYERSQEIRNARLIAAAPDMRETILTLCADVERLNAAIVRQAGAAKTLRECTLAEVRHLKDKDRSEYRAAASLDSERKANELLTDENERWQKNSAETWEAMQTMRNAINEHIPMPSMESDLLQGPENSVFCAAVAEAVITGIQARAAAAAGDLRKALQDIIADRPSEKHNGNRNDLIAWKMWRRARAALAQKGGE